MENDLKMERINYLKDKIYEDGKIVFIDDDILPETFAQDMKCIFGCNPETDIVRGALRGWEWNTDCTVLVIEKDISREDILVALADYINGLSIESMICAFQENGTKIQYAIYLGDKYVEDPIWLYIGDTFLIADNANLVIENELSLGMNANGDVSEVAKNIANGYHYTKELIDVNDVKLI